MYWLVLLQKPSTASGYITAHMSRIHDIDWCYYDENQLTTCSHDGSVKFWDIKSPREPFNTIKVGAQKLWRAKNYVSDRPRPCFNSSVSRSSCDSNTCL